MGQASRAPNLKDATSIEFSTHAMERIRERLPPGSHYQSMPDADIRRRVEEAWQNARRADDIEEWWQLDDGSNPETIFVIDLQDSLDARVVGVFRVNERKGKGPALVTVLTHEMATKKKMSNQWASSIDKLGRRELFQRPMATLSALPNSATPVVAQSASPDDEIVLVTWWDQRTNDPEKLHRTHRLARRHVSEFISGLMDVGVELEEIEIWTKREMKVKKVVTVSF